MLYIIIALSATTLVLISGLVVMAVGGKLNKKFSSSLMSLRVLFQAIAIGVVLVLYLWHDKS